MARIDPKMNVYEFFHMHITSEKFYFEPRQSDGGQIDGEKSCLVIDRNTNDISVQPRHVLPNYAEIKKVFGIFGIIRLITGPNIIVVTQRHLIGLINGEYIYRVGSTEIIPYALSVQHFTEAEIRENQVYTAMVRNVLDFDSYYFSPSYDLTHTLQRLQNTDPQFLQLSMQERADPRFVWNGYVLRDLSVVPDAQKYAMPIMLGFVSIRTCRVAGQVFQLSLISRRSCFRAGVRLQTRGLDVEGHSANSVETEQIIEYGDAFTSFVQTRGSIPVYWSQKPNFRWLPKPKLKSDEDHVQGFKLHIQQHLFHYERLCLINLVNHKGSEKVMADALEYLCKNSGIANVHLVSFDFHHQCRNMNWTKLYELIKDLNEWITGFGFFCARRIETEIRQVKRQTGVFRTNCMDCLDRTNVVQSLLAKSSLENQLRYLQILTENDALDRYVEFDAAYKNMWADNGDSLSIQYAGTGALKADFTRVGRRTYSGALNDGKNASTRWVINNFYDGFRQDAIDFFLGNSAIEEGNPLRHRLSEWEFRHYLYAAVAVAMAMLVLCFIVSTEYTVHFGLIWFVVCLALLGYIVMNGEQLVNRPKLKLD